MSHLLRTALLGAVVLLLIAGNSLGIEKQKETADHFGFKIGMLHGGTVTLNDRTDWETSTGLSFGVTFDFRTIRQFYLGLAIDMHQVKVSVGPYSDDAYMLNGSIVARQVIPLGKKGWQLRPGIGFGGAAMGKLGSLENSTYLTITPVVELLAPVGPTQKLLIEFALLTADGSDTDNDVTSGGHLLTRIGFLF